MRTLGLVLRTILGIVFLLAGLTKLFPPDHRFLFEISVSSYGLLPPSAVVAIAAVLPWLEILLGIALLAGWQVRFLSSVALIVLVAFTGIMASAYFRGIQADCGCFGFGESVSSRTLARDAVLVLAAALLTVQSWLAWRTSRRRTGTNTGRAYSNEAGITRSGTVSR